MARTLTAERDWGAQQRVVDTRLRATLRGYCHGASVSMSGEPLTCDLEFGHGGNHAQHTADGTRALEWHE